MIIVIKLKKIEPSKVIYRIYKLTMSVNSVKRLKLESGAGNVIPKSLSVLFNKVQPKYESVSMDIYNSYDEEMKLYFEICIEQLVEKLNKTKRDNYAKLEFAYANIWTAHFDHDSRRHTMIYNSALDMFATVCKNKGYEYEKFTDSKKITTLVIYLSDELCE